MGDMDEVKAINDDLKRAERRFQDVADRLADSQDAYERGKLIERMDAIRLKISRYRSELRLATGRLTP